jgi:hypothetical protein
MVSMLILINNPLLKEKCFIDIHNNFSNNIMQITVGSLELERNHLQHTQQS